MAAADYFMTQRWRCWWWALSLLGVVLLYRQGRRGSVHPMQHCFDALDAGDILILYPEGSRGCPEQRQPFKRGIVRLLKHYPQAGVTPVMLKGVGRVLPRGEVLPVPVNCDVAVGEPLYWQDDEAAFMAEVEARFHELSGVGVANQ